MIGDGQAVSKRFSGDARATRELLRGASLATLATLDRATGHPMATLVQMATLPDARPCILISELAQHTQNLRVDPRASILVDQRSSTGGVTAARVTVSGSAVRLEGAVEERARSRLLGRHPAAESYAAFGDFGFWAVSIQRAHTVAGFGRIKQFDGSDIELADMSEELAAGEHDVLSQLQNEFAQQLTSASAKLIGLDVEGLDLWGSAGACRLTFAQPVLTLPNAFTAARLALQQIGSSC